MSRHLYNNYCKSSILCAVNYQPLRIIINHKTTMLDIKKVIKVSWRINPLNLRLFLSNGSEIFENDLKYIQQGTKIYASIDGQDLGVNILFLSYSIKDKISQSLIGITMLGTINSNKKEVVIKQQSTKLFTSDELSELIQTIQTVQEMNNNKIVAIQDMVLFTKVQEIVIISEYCQGTSLKQLLSKNIILGEIDIKNIIRQACEGIAFLHSNNIIIKNIKLENIIFSEKNNLQSLKLSDVGLNNIYKVFHLTSIENFNYFSPDLLLHKQFTFASDIWALGVIIYYLYFKRFPFDGRKKSNIQQNIFSNKLSLDEPCQQTLKDMFQVIFTPKEAERITISNLLDHPWLKQVNKINISKLKTQTPFLRLNSKQSFRGRTNSQRLDSDENNSSIKRTARELQKQKSLDKEQCVTNSLHFKQQLERKRCLSHMLIKKHSHRYQTIKEF